QESAARIPPGRPGGTLRRDIGTHPLRGISHPVRLHQLIVDGLPVETPSLRGGEGFLHNFPLQLSTFVGRVAAVQAIQPATARARLVTVIGSGGVGNTRLAVEAAKALVDAFPDGAWLVDFAAGAEAAPTLKAIAVTLGIREEIGRPLSEVLERAL